ncbi:hypothetical protein NBRGN_069_00180 [Nocardia brasiliensis NBRC 14402]|uniref:hypothetical protein n=1 Tax=Nocardia brasiliensis TaxID=37326 RepID=UPI00045CA41E|nr:hypothetical protein [Nocardia brasiliensis]AVL26246.1 hypothetical protein CEQ30_02645 [Nocardia brasiliensis]GAJ84186.1 hypothetical protein NBRGN_069_00180 [Nocardia brasiliensis NBRC 14402]SUB55687.1 Uncharacterised protein [Nocardia brasiliensis]
MQANSGEQQTDPPVGLDLVAPEMYAPMLRRLALAAAGIGIGTALLAATVVTWPVAVLIGVVVGAPTVAYAVALRRRRMWLAGTTIHARRVFGERRVEVSAATGVEVLIFPARLSRIVLRVTAGEFSQIIPLAMYTDAGGGREMHLLGLRRLADALATSQLAAAVSVSTMLVHQLRAEARDAHLAERPLYRAVQMARTKDFVSPIVLTDREVAALI